MDSQLHTQVSEVSTNGAISGTPATKVQSPPDIQPRVTFLLNLIQKEIKRLNDDGIFLDRATQEELSNLINLLQAIEKRFIYNNEKKQCPIKLKQLSAKLNFIQIALEAILQKQPNVCLSKRIRRHVEYCVGETENPLSSFWKNSISKIVHLGSTPNKLMAGLVLALPIYLGIASSSIAALTYLSRSINNIPSVNSSNVQPQRAAMMSRDYFDTLVLLALVGSAGALGSIISILTRIEEYQNKDYDDSILPIAIGAFKPLIGASFGILLFTISCSTVSPLQIAENANRPETKGFTFFSLAFIVGFSERFAKDIISRTEGSLSGSSNSDQAEE